MKVFFILGSALFLWSACQQPRTFKLSGSLPGAKDGTVVKLVSEEAYPEVTLDSAVVSREHFVMQGQETWAYPKYCRLVVDLTPQERDPYEKQMKAYAFFVDNTDMHFACPVDSLPSYFWSPRQPKYQPVVTGAPVQELYETYLAKTKALRERAGELREQYLEVYHRPALEGVFHTQEGMKIVRETEEVSDELNGIMLDFILENNRSVVALLITRDLLARNRTRLTLGETEGILNQLDATLKQAPMMKEVEELAQNMAVVAKGEKYKDVELTDLNGKRVKLSEVIKPGQYNMLEFWASWCGPCRGEIPHLRHIYEQGGKEHFNIISISLDEKDAEWKKAVSEEKMEWTQLCDQQGWNGPAATTYHVSGVPFSLVLDPEGRIVVGNVRGAELDVVLEECLGDKIRMDN